MERLNDEEIAVRYRESGDSGLLEELVVRHIAAVRAMIYPMVLNDADADDLTQEVFIRASRGLVRFKARSRFRTWLYRIAMNTTYSFLKRRARNPVVPHADPPERQDAGAAPDSVMAARELDGEIGEALASLSPRLRAAIGLTAIQGMPVRDAAAVEGCLPATMYWRVHEARRILKGRLGEYMAG
jgi:RNA polymerase sigma-70 factor (ECF subfamily)